MYGDLLRIYPKPYSIYSRGTLRVLGFRLKDDIVAEELVAFKPTWVLLALNDQTSKQ